jgi:uncharacterized protein
MVIDDDAGVAQILAQCRVIAVVGLSPKPERPSFGVAQAMQRAGVRIVPVNPLFSEILGEPCYPDLASIPFPVDMVNCFRRAEEMPQIANQLKMLNTAPQVLWMQLAISSLPAAQIASDLGINVVMDRCWKVEYQRLATRPPSP